MKLENSRQLDSQTLLPESAPDSPQGKITTAGDPPSNVLPPRLGFPKAGVALQPRRRYHSPLFRPDENKTITVLIQGR